MPFNLETAPMHDCFTLEEMQQRLVRYGDLRPCLNAFVDTYTPGSTEKENFTIIGPGVSENPDQHVHIRQAHGFNIGGARQPPNCTNSQHSHETEEVFIVHSGTWAFHLGEKGQDGEIILQPGDCISIPVNVFRGFENVGSDMGYLFAVLGRNDPGHVTWAPDVFDKAKQYGLILTEKGSLVDTSKGEKIPEGHRAMAKTTSEQVAAHRLLSGEEAERCVCPNTEQQSSAGSALTQDTPGVTESPIIGPANPSENIAAGKIHWPHGFHVRRLDFEPGADLGFNARAEEEVLFIHKGELLFQWPDGELSLGAGDVLTVPIGLAHGYLNGSNAAVQAYAVRGGNSPAGPHRSAPSE